MVQFSGKTVYQGIALGRIVVWKQGDVRVSRRDAEDAETEIQAVKAAVIRAQEQLQSLYDRALQKVGESNAAIFKAHQLMLADEDYLNAIQNRIRKELVSAAYAVRMTGNQFAEIFMGMDDAYMRERVEDVKDVSDRLICILEGGKENVLSLSEPSIIVADALSPSEMMQLNKENVLGIVTVHGAVNSHAAILARMMCIPALTGVPVNLEEIHTGMQAVVDGLSGKVIFEPDEPVCVLAEKVIETEKEKRRLLETLKGKKTVTADGRKLRLYANAGNIADVEYALENDAEGIGLFRSEFLYLGRDSFPTEEEQFQAYKQAAQRMAGKKVVIRTLDIGADKQTAYFHLDREENPAMGYRAIRICLTHPVVFQTQLRALLRAAALGNISIMYPMIVSVEEVQKIYEMVDEAEQELKGAGIPYRRPEQGIMIETPAAVMVSDELAQLVDFFSIGTNDLTQYTLAIDRQNGKLDAFYDPHHKAVMRMIRMTVENAHKYGKWAGICGELGADLALTEEFIRMGVDELSVAPSMVLKVREAVRNIDLTQNQ